MEPVNLRWNPEYCIDGTSLNEPKFMRDWKWGMRHLAAGIKARPLAFVGLFFYCLTVVLWEQMPSLLAAFIERGIVVILGAPIAVSAWNDLRNCPTQSWDTKYKSDRLKSEQADIENASLFGDEESSAVSKAIQTLGTGISLVSNDPQDRKDALEPNLYITTVYYSFCVGLLTILFIVPGIWFGTTRCLGFIIMCVERKKMAECFQESCALVKDNFGRTARYMVGIPTLMAIGALVVLMIPYLVAVFTVPESPTEKTLLVVTQFLFGFSLLMFQLSCFPMMAYMYGWLKQKQIQSQLEPVRR